MSIHIGRASLCVVYLGMMTPTYVLGTVINTANNQDEYTLPGRKNANPYTDITSAGVFQEHNYIGEAHVLLLFLINQTKHHSLSARQPAYVPNL